MTARVLGLIVLGAALAGAPALAHHSTAMFDQSKVTYRTGTIKQLEWVNPHVWLHVTLTDGNGREAVWSFEAGSPLQLTQLGWKPDNFRAGAKVDVGFRPMKDGSRGGQLMNVTPAGGQKVCSNRGCE
ncbi:MAG: hypothetical protein HYU37_17605 [Acidobacteria bacterium]|nr:hypothetical protein [Acidobacteriota bacterium]